jgi:hypothetical protein
VVRYTLLLMLVYVWSPLQAQTNLQRGLLACYAFNGDAKDGSGNGYNGTLHGPMLTFDRFGLPGKAYFFDGKDDYIGIPSAPFRNQNFTFSMWVNVSPSPDQRFGTVISIGGQEGLNNGIEVHNSKNLIDNAELGFSFLGTVDQETAIAGASVLKFALHWYHLAAARTSTNIKMYVDGKLILDAPVHLNGSPAPVLYQDPLVALIGMRSSFLYPFYGIIDDLVIYDRALSDDEVYKLYTDGIPCGDGPLAPIPLVKDMSLCGTADAVLTASGGTHYRWYDAETEGNMIFEGNPFIVQQAHKTTSYYVSNVTGTGESRRRKVTVTVHPIPEVMCTFPESLFTGSPETFVIDVTGGTPPFLYHFNFGDGTELDTPINEHGHTYLTEGSYDVSITTTDSAGCATDCSSRVKVFKEDLFIPNVITPNDDDHNEVFNLYLKVGPDYLSYPGQKVFVLRIFNRWGEEVFISDNPSAGWKADGYSAGVYYYEIIIGEERFKGPLIVVR